MHQTLMTAKTTHHLSVAASILYLSVLEIEEGLYLTGQEVKDEHCHTKFHRCLYHTHLDTIVESSSKLKQVKKIIDFFGKDSEWLSTAIRISLYRFASRIIETLMVYSSIGRRV